jgi:hypothetical protein
MWNPWVIVGLVVALTFLPTSYRKARIAFFRRRGFVSLGDLLEKSGTSSKEFWDHATARGLKVRLRSRGGDPLVNLADGMALIDTLPRPAQSAGKFAEELRLVGLSAVAAASAAKFSEPIGDGSSFQRIDGDNWTVERRGQQNFTNFRKVWSEDLYSISLNPTPYRSPLQLWSRIVHIPKAMAEGTIIEVHNIGSWMQAADGVCSEVVTLRPRFQNRLPWEADFMAELGKALKRSLKGKKENYSEIVRLLCQDGNVPCRQFGYALWCLSDDRQNPRWRGIMPIAMPGEPQVAVPPPP